MTDQRSPWARPPAGSGDPAGDITYPTAGATVPERRAAGATDQGGATVPERRAAGATDQGGATAPDERGATAPDQRGAIAPAQRGAGALSRPAGYRSGVVTGLSLTPPPPPPAPAPAPPDPGRRNQRMLWWFGGAALGVIAVGVVTLLVFILSGGGGPFARRLAGPSDTRPDLAKLCPPPSQDAASGAPAPPPPPGPRTVDADSGISYAAYGDPWLPWRDVWTKGTLHVSYRTGQYFVTESYVDENGFQNQYLASILSGSVPAANNDTLSLDLQCTGRQVAADVRAEYYPQPNTVEVLREEQTTLGGRPAWVTKFRMHFHRAGLKATDELVGLALVDVGRPRAAVLYVSIPGTHHDYDRVVDDVLASVRPVG